MKKHTFFRHVLVISAALAAPLGPARALVGAMPDGRFADRVVMVLTKGAGEAGFCSALVLNSRIVLTAAHCLRPLNDMAVNYRDASGTPILIPVEAALAHPLYRPNAIRERVMSIGVALIRTARPLDPRFVGASLAMGEVPAVGEQIILSGYGAAREGDWSSSGTLRSVTLAVRDPASKVLIWAADPTGAEAGACSGDAGAPIWSADGRTAVAIVTWGQALNGRGCGGLTQGPWLAPLRDWIEETERSLGGPAPAPAPAATPAPVVASAPPPAYAPAPAPAPTPQAGVKIPPENRAGYDVLCRADWTKRGILDKGMYDYCMSKMHNAYTELVVAVDKYKDTIWIQDVVNYAVDEWTKRDTRDDSMVVYEVKKEDGFEDLSYEVKQTGFDQAKFDDCLDRWGIQFHMVMHCYKEDSPGSQVVERARETEALHRLFDAMRGDH